MSFYDTAQAAGERAAKHALSLTGDIHRAAPYWEQLWTAAERWYTQRRERIFGGDTSRVMLAYGIGYAYEYGKRVGALHMLQEYTQEFEQERRTILERLERVRTAEANLEAVRDHLLKANLLLAGMTRAELVLAAEDEDGDDDDDDDDHQYDEVYDLYDDPE